MGSSKARRTDELLLSLDDERDRDDEDAARLRFGERDRRLCLDSWDFLWSSLPVLLGVFGLQKHENKLRGDGTINCWLLVTKACAKRTGAAHKHGARAT